MKILDFDLEGSHFIIEADISPRQEADDDMECQWLRYDFDNTQVYKETDGAVSPFQITAVAWAGYQLTADHALKDVIGRISRNETGKLTVHYVCPELQEFFDELKKYPAISGERTIPYFIFHGGDIAKLAYATNEFLYYEDSNYMPLMFRTVDGTLVSDNESDLDTITPEIQTPRAVGQYQHGSARWMTDSEKDKAFDSYILDPHDPTIRQLLETGYDGLDFLKEK